MKQQFNSVWITANAGSGKTTYLTKRVLNLLLLGVTPERICCITYTKAAASEMRHRVLKQLRTLLLANEETCVKIISEVLERPATSEDIARARGLFGMVLESESGGLQLTTVHGFCQSILRKFPLEAGINPHFTVLEEAAADRLITTEKNRLLNSYQGDYPPLTAALELIASRMKEARFDQLIADIISKRNAWEQAWRNQPPELLRSKLYALHGLSEDVTEEKLLCDFTECIDTQSAQIIRQHLTELQIHKNKREQVVAKILTQWLQEIPENRLSQIEDFFDLFLTKEDKSIRKSLLGKDYPLGSPLRDTLETIAQYVCRFNESRAGIACAEESFATAILARELLALYTHAKQRHHALDYDDLIAKTRELFANQSMLGWVMSKLDQRIDHLLVDEAQDTSGEQWAITTLLVDELIATNDGLGSGNIPRSVLVVGDEKQSIYSFQGAAPELFSYTNKAFDALLSGSNAPLKNEQLSNSYRSTAPVLTFVDHIAEMPEMLNAFQGQSQKHILIREHEAGSITLYPIVQAPEKIDTPPLTMPLTYTHQQTAAQILAEEVAHTIHGWISKKRLIENTGQPIQPGDILILVHKRAPMALPLIRALQRYDVPVAGMDRLTLASHLAVRDLLALMRWAQNPADDLALAQILRSPLIGMNEKTLETLCLERKGTLWASIENQPLLDEALDHKHTTPYDFLTHILETLSTRKFFAIRFGQEVHEVLDELKAQAAAMPEDVAITLANFYDSLSGSTRQIKREQESGEQNQVRIMTVHGAKGLEARVVMLVDTTRPATTQKEMVYFAADAHQQRLPVLAISDEAKFAPTYTRAKQAKADSLMAEYYRLLYVALTRAKDELHIWGSAAKANVSPQCWYALAERAMATLGTPQENGTVLFHQPATRAPKVELAAHTKSTLQTMPDWAIQKPLSSRAAQKRFSPSQLTDAPTISAYVEVNGTAVRTRGVHIHRLLELVNASSTQSEIVRLAALIAPEWSEQECITIADEILALIHQETWIWQYPSQAEANIAGTVIIGDEKLPISGQIDRIVHLPDQIVVMDYKTGRHIPQTAQDISEIYRLQMKAYLHLLQNIWPDKPIRCAILWTAAPSIMWCDEVVANTPWPAKALS